MFFKQAGDRHRPDAAGDRRDRARHRGRLGKGHIADELALAVRLDDAVDADIDHDGAGLDPVALHELGLTDCRHHEVGAAHHVGKVLGARMRDGHRAVLAQQKLSHRLADDVGASDDDRVEARQIVLHRLCKDDRADRRARRQRALADRELADVDGVEAVDVLGRIDRIQHLHAVDVLGQRHLHENAVHGRVAVEARDEIEQRGLRRLLRQLVLEGLHADLDGLLGLVAHVDLARRVLAHEHHREPGRKAVLRLHAGDVGRHIGAHLGGNRLSVDDVGMAHWRQSSRLFFVTQPPRAWPAGAVPGNPNLR